MRVVLATTVPVTAWSFYREHLRQFAAAGAEIVVVSSPGAHLDRIAALGYRTEAIPMAREIAPVADLIALLRWYRLVRDQRPDLVITATPKAALLGLCAAWVGRVPERTYCVGGLRLEGERGVRRTVLTAVERLTGAFATDITVNSASLRRRATDLRLFARAKTRPTVPGSSHGVDTEHFRPQPVDPALRERLGLRRDIPTAVFIGRLTRDKGIDSLIEAMTVLRKAGRELQLVVVGPQDEPDSQHYVTLLSAALPEVVIAGAADDVRPYLALADVHVLPSLREGFPNVVLEAAACSVPTVTTDATGCIDSVRPGETGLIVPAGDGTALAAALTRLLDDLTRARAMGAAARDWVTAEFTESAVVRSVVGPILARVTSARGRARIG